MALQPGQLGPDVRWEPDIIIFVEGNKVATRFRQTDIPRREIYMGDRLPLLWHPQHAM
jgi:hypothetical protein